MEEVSRRQYKSQLPRLKKSSDCLKSIYRETARSSRCPVGTSPPFDISVGVHQWLALSPLLLVLCMDTATADLQTPYPWSLLYANDVLLADEERQELQHQMQHWSN
uniref:Reverse transcriptase domain-containing protein n=1 Tax=Romanomermis culicivorax TaxID=13658 RepID=A0A915HP81_ROMCU